MAKGSSATNTAPEYNEGQAQYIRLYLHGYVCVTFPRQMPRPLRGKGRSTGIWSDHCRYSSGGDRDRIVIEKYKRVKTAEK